MAYEENNFKLLDKVIYHFVNYNKPLGFESIGEGCSGIASPLRNDSIEGIIIEIIKTETNYYYFGDDYEEQGEYTIYKTTYKLHNLDTPLEQYQIKKV